MVDAVEKKAVCPFALNLLYFNSFEASKKSTGLRAFEVTMTTME